MAITLSLLERYTDKIFTTPTKTTVEYTLGYLVDIYTPENDTETQRPVVIWLHGGGGARDDAGSVDWARDEWARRGYLGLSPSYKPNVGGDHDATEQKQSIINLWYLHEYLLNNQVALGIKNWVAQMGISFGGITAIQSAIALNDRDDSYFGLSGSILTAGIKVRASATLAGAANDLYQGYIDGSDARNHFYHGDQDHTVEYSQAVDAYDTMIAAGIPSTFMTFSGVGHGIGNKPTILADLVPKFKALL